MGKNSSFTKLVSAEQVEQAAAQQFVQMQSQAAAAARAGARRPPAAGAAALHRQAHHPVHLRLEPARQQWKWEVNLLGSPQINAFCMPGGKIAFFCGILQKLQLDDDEVAMIMGHEMAHALREHARERMGKSLRHARRDRDRRGAARPGRCRAAGRRHGRPDADAWCSAATTSPRPTWWAWSWPRAPATTRRAGVTLWQKMGAASKGAPPEFLSTHPSGPTRIKDIQANLPKVEGLYARADKPGQRFEPPPLARGEQRRRGAAETLKRARRAGQRGPGVAAAQALRAFGLVPRAVHPPECG